LKYDRISTCLPCGGVAAGQCPSLKAQGYPFTG
jgi:hypothetical protein